eukprot:scaffold1164_cov232-Pinguiococcus_pyrenoidosus.AAC.1
MHERLMISYDVRILLVAFQAQIGEHILAWPRGHRIPRGNRFKQYIVCRCNPNALCAHALSADRGQHKRRRWWGFTRVKKFSTDLQLLRRLSKDVANPRSIGRPKLILLRVRLLPANRVHRLPEIPWGNCKLEFSAPNASVPFLFRVPMLPSRHPVRANRSQPKLFGFGETMSFCKAERQTTSGREEMLSPWW